MLPDQQPQDLYSKNNHTQKAHLQTAYLNKPLAKIEENQSRKDALNSLRPLKPIAQGKDNQVSNKAFQPQVSSTHYNSQKNLRNNIPQTSIGTLGNNRYSSQNMKGCEYDEEEEEQIDEAEMGLEVADEKYAQITCTEASNQQQSNFSQTQRRGSQRYKDRVHTMRLQSQETYQREHMAHVYFTEMQGERKQVTQYNNDEDDDFEIFERAQDNNQICSQRSKNYNNYKNSTQIQNDQDKLYQNSQTELTLQNQTTNNVVSPATFYHQERNQQQQDKRWTTQPNQGGKHQIINQIDDETPKEDLSSQYFDPSNGAHFQYRELLKRLSDITSSSQGNSSSTRKFKSRKAENENRVPLKEKTQEIVNQIQNPQTSKKKNQSILETNKGRPFSNSAKNPKKIEKVANQISMANNSQANQQKLSKLLLHNQENNFIEKKFRDLQGQNKQEKEKLMQSNSNISKNLSINQHKSHNNLLKTNDALSKVGGQQQCQINNMKLKSSTQQSHSQTSQQKQQQTSIINNQTKIPVSSKPNTQNNAAATVTSINNIFSNAIVNSSISSGNAPNAGGSTHTSSNGGAFVNGTKCPSSNFLRTATTAFTTSTTTKSSAILTQCNSNKQINNKETPETRQRVRLTGTALSSTSKRNIQTCGSGTGTGGATTTLSNNSQGNTLHNSQKGFIGQQFGYQQDSDKRSGQNSEQKQGNKGNNNTSGNGYQHPTSAPRSNSSHKKVQVQKMLIKNQSFHKGMINDNPASKKQMNEFYNAIFKKISNTNFTALTTNSMKMSQARLSETKKQTVIGQSSKTTRVSGKVSRLSKGGSNTASVNSNSKSQKRSAEKIQGQQSPSCDSHSKSKTRKTSNNIRCESSGADKNTIVKQNSMNLMNPATNQINLQKVNQLIKRFQDSTLNPAQPQNPQQQLQQQPQQKNLLQQQQSILINHQLKKQTPIVSNNSRPLSGNNCQSNNHNHLLSEQQTFNRKNSKDNGVLMGVVSLIASEQSNQPQYQMQTEQHQMTVAANENSFDNRQSLQVQHRTIEKKSYTGRNVNQNAQQQINLKQSEKMSKYLQQKKEELAQATSQTKSQSSNHYQQQQQQPIAASSQSTTGTKKGFLLANIKIQKNSRLQQMTQETYERLHLPTEEDDMCGRCNDGCGSETFQIGNLIQNGDEMYSIYNDNTISQNSQVNKNPPPLSGNRNSVKVKAKNF